jgi:hypothetical protein
MFKKSLVLSIAVVLTAVLFIFTGCQNPDAPVVNEGETNVTLPPNGSTEITIKNPDTVPALPEGFTYPSGAAKVLAGNATDIALAFNGGILVADTSDADGTKVTGTDVPGTGYAYSQDAVDEIIWTGPGTRSVNTLGADVPNLGSIAVPPGKTLYIAAPLVIDATPDSNLLTAAQWFSSITVSDQGGYPNAAASIQANTLGGAPVGGNKAGKIVILAGGSIGERTGGAAGDSITIGGELEIHRGASINVSALETPFTTTAGSRTVVYGSLVTGNPAVAAASVLNLLGTLVVKGGGTVDVSGLGGGDSVAFGSVTDDVTVESYGTLTINGGVFNETFYGNLTVGPVASLVIGGGTTTFNKKATFDGELDARGAGNIVVGTSGHLAIEATGTIRGTWANFFVGAVATNAGTPASLKAAFGAAAADVGSANNRVTIADPGTGAPVYLDLNLTLTPTATYPVNVAYPDLVWFAESTKLHLNSLTYGNPFGRFTPLIDTDNGKLTIVAGNHVILGADGIGDVEVQSGGSVNFNVAINSAGIITLVGRGRPANSRLTLATSPNVLVTPGNAIFDTALDGLTIGDGTVATALNLNNATLAGAKTNPDETATSGIIIADKHSVITVKKGSSLEVGGVADPGGEIILEASADNTDGGQFTITNAAGAVFNELYRLDIGAKAAFNGGTGNDITFQKLRLLTVNGELHVYSSTNVLGLNDPIGFQRIQRDFDSVNDVTGTGKAYLYDWDVSLAREAHAYDQLRAIKYLVLNNIKGIGKISGTGTTPDQAAVPADAVLVVRAAIVDEDTDQGLIIPANRSLIIDRDVYLDKEAFIIGVASVINNKITLSKGKGIYAGDNAALADREYKPVLIGSALTDTTVFTLPVAAPVLTNPAAGVSPDAGKIVATVSGIVVDPGYTLDIPGELTLTAVTLNAGVGTGLVDLKAGTILKDVSISVAGTAAVTVPPDQELTGRKGSVTVRGKLTVGGVSTIGANTAGPINYQKSTLILAQGGVVSATTAANTLAIGPGVQIGGAVAESTLTGGANTTNTITVVDATETKFEGLFTGTGPQALLGLGTTAKLRIMNNSVIRQQQNGYEWAELKGGAGDSTVLMGANIFGDGNITISAVSGLLTDGNLTTGKGGGGLVVAPALIRASGANGQPLTNLTFDGNMSAFYAKDGQSAAVTWTLSADTEIVVAPGGAATFFIGRNSGGTPTTQATILNVNDGKITFGDANAGLAVNSDGTPTVTNSLKIGTYTFSSLAGADDEEEYEDYGQNGEAGPNDIFVEGTSSGKTGTNADSAGGGGGSDLTVDTGKPTINGHVDGSTITKETKLIESGT